MKLEDVKNLGILAALAGGAALAYSFLGNAKRGLATAGEAIGSGLYDLLHPNQIGETKFYVATFPDGVRHSIPASWVNVSGQFVNKQDPNNLLYKGDGKRYQLVTNKSTGAMAAFPL